MRIVVIILLVLVLLLAAVLMVGGMLLDKDYALERSVIVAAPPEAIHALVGDLSRWEEWTPWKAHDKTVAVTLGAQTTGVGASQTWTAKEGDGELTFTKWDPKTGVEYDMAFLADGDRLASKGALVYEPAEGGTRVTWKMRGSMEMAIVGGYVATQMDSMVGPRFEEGLRNLKERVERVERAPAANEPVGTGG
jgi:hypothetical protein